MTRALPAGMLLLLALAMTACGRQPPSERTTMNAEQVSAVLDRHSAGLMAIPGVQATYVGAGADSQPCIRVILVEGVEGAREKVPTSIEGVPVEIEVSDPIRPMGGNPR